MNDLFKALYKYRLQINNSDTTSLSYYIILSVVPILSLILITFSYLHFDIQMVKENLLRYFSSDVSMLIVDYLTSRDANYFSLAAIGLSLLVSSRGFYRLKQVADRLYDFPITSIHRLKHRLFAVLNTLTFVILVTVFMMLFGILPSLSLLFEDWIFNRYVVNFILLFVLMLLINMIVPTVWPGFRAGLSGALVSTIGLEAIHLFIRFFSNAATYDTVYGPLASLAALLIMLNWISHVIYFGICYSSVIYVKEGKHEGFNSKSNN